MNALSKCKCAHHGVVPGLVVLLALAVLLGNLGILTAHLTGILWPSALILIGLMKMCGKNCKCCNGCF